MQSKAIRIALVFCGFIACAWGIAGSLPLVRISGKVLNKKGLSPVAGVEVKLKIFTPGHGLAMGSYKVFAEQRSGENGSFQFDVPAMRPFAIESKSPGQVFGGGYKTFASAHAGMFIIIKHDPFVAPPP